MRKTKFRAGKFITTLFTTLLLTAAVSVSAGEHCPMGGKTDGTKASHPHGQMSGNMMMKHGYGDYDKEAMVATLALTDDQKAKVKEIWEGVQKESTSLKEEMEKTGADIGTALSGDEPNFRDAKKASKKIGQLKIKMKENYFDALEDTYDLLTPDQRKNWGKAMEAFKGSDSTSVAAQDCPLKGTKDCPMAKDATNCSTAKDCPMNNAAVKDCPLKGTKDCPMAKDAANCSTSKDCPMNNAAVKDCPLKGTKDCPMAKDAANCSTAKDCPMNNAAVKDCPLKGTKDCPMAKDATNCSTAKDCPMNNTAVKDCPLKGTKDCPLNKEAKPEKTP